MPDPPIHVATDASLVSLEALIDFMEGAERVWYIFLTAHRPFGTAFEDVIKQDYMLVGQQCWGAPYFSTCVIEFRRIPDDLHDMFTFGETVSMQGWELQNDVHVQPCQRVTLESWWQASETPDVNYGMSLSLVNDQGALVQAHGSPGGVLTGLWQPDELHYDRRALDVPCDISPGQYPLLVVVYDPDTGAPLEVTAQDGAPLGGHAYLTTLFVE